MRLRPRPGSVHVLSTFALAVALPAGGGCSFVFVRPPRDDGGALIAEDCTTNAAAPVIDTMLAGTNLFSSFYVADQDHVANKAEAVALGLTATAVWLSSAIYGYYYTTECRNLNEGDRAGPYGRRVRLERTVLSGPPGPRAPAADGAASEPAASPARANAAPAGPPAARQQRDDDDPGTNR